MTTATATKQDGPKTITHITTVNGRDVTYQLPIGTPKELMDTLITRLNEEAGAEVTAGTAGARTALELAVTLQATNPELRDKSWKQLCQEPAYSIPVTDAYASHGKDKSTYSKARTKLREDTDALRAWAAGIEVVKRGLVSVDDVAERWYLDPDREKNGGGRKRTPDTEVTFTAKGKDVGDDDLDDDASDNGTDSLAGLMSAVVGKHIARNDLKPNPAEFLNQLRALGRWVDNAKVFAINVMKLEQSS